MSLSVQRTCDGCGEPGDSMERVLALDYCAKCKPLVDAFVELVSALHTQAAADWQEKMNLLRGDFSSIKELPY